ncbi:EAL domain-containing protein [Exilibacterium tricleocarpae]|uniref:EAL domain-containing protein n=1 Tax=Exilibacterium tricleocarpae TaxID=2591008 RepID=A0A545U3X1_9GAMM|nr:EAL domain-containing protein [Exilibacterium tricleocarpae]TQV84169.1 EAL domain-containing protein [Exilibacterium tricleocarpae]
MTVGETGKLYPGFTAASPERAHLQVKAGSLRQFRPARSDAENRAALVVSDDAECAAAIVEVLETLGVDVLTGTSIADAGERMRRGGVALAVLDLERAGGEGLAAALPVLDACTGGHSPVIVITADTAGVNHLIDAGDSGLVDCLFKPLDPTLLAAKVKVFLALEARNRELEAAYSLAYKHHVQQQLLLGAVDEGVLGIDPAGVISYANAGAVQLLGAFEVPLVGRHISDFFGLEDDVEHAVAELCCPAGGLSRDLAADFWCMDGEKIPVTYTCAGVGAIDGIAVGAVVVFRDRRYRPAAEEPLLRSANYDKLTGLANRRMFHDFFVTTVEGASTGGAALALLLIDLDNFKDVNGTLGPRAGDALLLEIARRIDDLVGPEDLLARINGDEFALVLPCVDAVGDIALLAGRIAVALAAAITIDGQEIHTTCSIGIATLNNTFDDTGAIFDSAAEGDINLGTEGFDTRNAAEGSDTRNVAEGSDTRNVAEGSDTRNVAEGSDTRNVAEGSDARNVAEGSDTRNVAEGSDTRNVAEGSDTRNVAEGSDTRNVAEGSDARNVAEGSDTRNVAEGSDTRNVAEGSDTRNVAEGSDIPNIVKGSAAQSEAKGPGTANNAEGTDTQNDTGAGDARKSAEVATDELLKAAGLALKKAKSDGGNCHCFYTAKLQKSKLRKLQIEHRIREFLSAGRFQLHFQPLVDCRSSGVIGAEALIRWPQDDDLKIGPDVFIPVAEGSGQIRGVGEWVLTTAVRALQGWLQRGLIGDSFKLAVNISTLQLIDESFHYAVRDLLDEYQVPSRYLEFELTESAVMYEPSRVIQNLNKLHALGITIAIDDFGTGYSSLSYLTRMPIDILKIDKCFVDGIGLITENEAVVRAVVAMGHNLELLLVAEGVEKDAQRRFLADNGCDYLQGYLFSRPLPEDEFVAFLAQRTEADSRHVDR